MNSPPSRSLAARPLVLSLAKLVIIAISQIPFATAAPVLSPLFHEIETPKQPSDPSLWLYLGVSLALVLSGGAFAGLTIALMGQVSVSVNKNLRMNQADGVIAFECRMKFISKS
jgi:metal transporter CNNM